MSALIGRWATGCLARRRWSSDRVRLGKLLSERNVCSRREAEHLLRQGWLTINGQPAAPDALTVCSTDVVEPSAEGAAYLRAQVTILLHKPVGVVSSQPEPGDVPAVRLIGASTQQQRADEPRRFDAAAHLSGLATAGRLDRESRGLLVLTQSGRVAQLLTAADKNGCAVTKVYRVRVRQPIAPRHVAELASGRIRIDGTPVRPCSVEHTGPGQLTFRLQEGRNRQIRRMCGAVGLEVVDLLRTHVGAVSLDVDEGRWRFLHESESFL